MKAKLEESGGSEKGKEKKGRRKGRGKQVSGTVFVTMCYELCLPLEANSLLNVFSCWESPGCFRIMVTLSLSQWIKANRWLLFSSVGDCRSKPKLNRGMGGG